MSRFKNLGRTSVLLVLVSVVGRSVAFVRDVLMAQAFGASRQTDAFFLAFSLVFRSAGLLPSAYPKILTPTLLDDERADPAAQRPVLGAALLVNTVLATLFCLLAGVFAVPILRAFGSEFTDQEILFAARLFRICLPMGVLLAVFGVLISLSHARGHFLLVGAAMSGTNVGAVLVLLVGLGRPIGLDTLAWGVTLGTAGGVVMLALYAARQGVSFAIDRSRLAGALRALGRSLALVTVGVSNGAVMGVAQRWLYAQTPEGQLTCLEYAFRVAGLPTTILFLGVLTTMLPAMAAALSAGEFLEAQRLANRAIRAMWVLLLPGCVALGLTAEPALDLLLGRGAFGPEETRLTALLVVCFLPAVAVTGVCEVLITCFLSFGRIGVPAVCGGVGTLTLLGVGVLVLPAGAPGLALALTPAQGVTLLLLVWAARRGLGFRWPGMGRFLLRTCLAAAAGSAALLATTALVRSLPLDGKLESFAVLAAGGAAFGAGYVGVAWLLRIEELRAVAARVRARFGR